MHSECKAQCGIREKLGKSKQAKAGKTEDGKRGSRLRNSRNARAPARDGSTFPFTFASTWATAIAAALERVHTARVCGG
jgi:hypothetical protein